MNNPSFLFFPPFFLVTVMERKGKDKTAPWARQFWCGDSGFGVIAITHSCVMKSGTLGRPPCRKLPELRACFPPGEDIMRFSAGRRDFGLSVGGCEPMGCVTLSALKLVKKRLSRLVNQMLH